MMSFGFPFLQNADAESGNIFSDIWSILSRDQCLTLSKWLWNSACVALRDLLPFVQFKNMKNTHGGVLLLVKLQTKSLQLH